MSRILKNCKNKITRGYRSGIHSGIDVIGDNGKKDLTGYADYITAHSNGVIVGLEKNCNKTYKTKPSYGNYVLIAHNNGMSTLYAHLKYGTVLVNKGDKVKKGQVIGYMGNTGRSRGVHLHFEIRNRQDRRINPLPYLDKDLEEKRGNDIMLPMRGYFMKNDRGKNVRVLQAFLCFANNDSIMIDGIVGNDTINSVKKFQKSNNLVVDGYFGPSCLAKMKELL